MLKAPARLVVGWKTRMRTAVRLKQGLRRRDRVIVSSWSWLFNLYRKTEGGVIDVTIIRYRGAPFHTFLGRLSNTRAGV